MKSFLREILVTLILAIVVFFTLQITVQSFIVIGNSMESSLHEGQRLLISKIVYSFHEPERGDIIVFRPPTDSRFEYIKRIIALPGETVEVKEGAVYVNGSQLYEPYIKDLPKYTLRKKKIPENKYFVLGDNRNNSNDSHNNWTVPRQNITGKAWLSIWPPDEWGLVPNYPLQEQLASSANEQATIPAEGAIWQ
jgi:signal peptidase I